MNTTNVKALIDASCKRIAPVWPLKNYVAVNPFVGFTDCTFSDTAKNLAKRGNIRMTMPLSFYLEQITNGTITPEAIATAFQRHGKQLNNFEALIKHIEKLTATVDESPEQDATLVSIASTITKKDWDTFMVDRISSWAAAYFDEYVALWNTTQAEQDVYQAWKAEATVDLSAELMGLPRFRATIKTLPDDSFETIAFILNKIKLPEETVEAYLHSVLLKTLGWSSYIAGLDFNNALYEKKDNRLQAFLAILLAWEFYFLEGFGNTTIKEDWYKKMHGTEAENSVFLEKIETELLLQDAYDIAHQSEIESALIAHKIDTTERTTAAQMVFCIDVRSEVYRRNLEQLDPTIATFGFAGFFGFAIDYVPLGHSEGKNQCPVLIPSSCTVKETFKDETRAKRKRTTQHQVAKTWKKFRSGAITSFGFVSPLGLLYLPKLIADSTGLTRPAADPKVDGLKKWLQHERILDLSAISLKQKVAMAQGALTGIGIKKDLAPVVLIAGHGSSSVNNPHAAGLDCGACGGHSGEINALTAQQILNDPTVRAELAKQGTIIPEKTLFVACLHDTTTDEIEILNEKFLPETHATAIQSIKTSLQKASAMSRMERAERLKISDTQFEKIYKKVASRAQDWSQIRPEWGLAGCSAFIIARRSRTEGLNLNGKAFLHSYDEKLDAEHQLLESIMTAPMVVTSWINLQYYASAVDPVHFGAGNKTLHNVTGGIGVMEGSNGDLRIGLPLQSVHNGEKLEHLPQRLNVIIEASLDGINSIIEKHAHVQQLFDHGWISLSRMDANGKISHRYRENGQWEATGNTSITQKEKELVTV